MIQANSHKPRKVPSSLESAFLQLKPLLIGALGRLTKQGFAVSPADGLDLVHDFLTEEIGKLRKHYEPRKGTFDAYTYKAFIQFARPRIMRLQRLQDSLVTVEELEHIPAPNESSEMEFAPDYQQPVKEAMEALSPQENSLLKSYIHAQVPSERLLAQGLGIPRYRVREGLVEALGKVVVHLNRPPNISERDWKVARGLWRERRTANEVACHLGLTNHQVRLSQNRVSKFLETALRNMQPVRHYSGRRIMKSQHRTIPPQQLLSEVLKAPGDVEMLQQLRDRSDEVLAALEIDDSALLQEDGSVVLEADWLADVYQALAGAAKLAPEEEIAAEALFNANVEEQRSVGSAFREVLWADLPAELRDLELWFRETPRVNSKQLDELLAQPSVEGGMPATNILALYGLTPMTLFYATESVSSALERLQDYVMIDQESFLWLGPDSVEAQGKREDLLTPESLIAEIRLGTKTDEPTARSLYVWLLHLAQYKPTLFEGFEAEWQGEGVRLKQTTDKIENLYERWRSPAFAAIYA